MTPEMAVHRAGVFGPVLCAMPFGDPAWIPRKTSDTRIGVAASTSTHDLARAHRLAPAIDADTVWINCSGVFDPDLPFGGNREPGRGRETAREGVEAVWRPSPRRRR